MAEAKITRHDVPCQIEYLGTVDFDILNYDNNGLNLYEIAVVDPETDEIVGEEFYTDQQDWQTAQSDARGRTSLDMDEETVGDVVAHVCGTFDTYEIEACIHVAYVIDQDEGEREAERF